MVLVLRLFEPVFRGIQQVTIDVVTVGFSGSLEDPLNAELLILGQRHFADDEHRLAVLSAQGQVVHAEVYVAWICLDAKWDMRCGDVGET